MKQRVTLADLSKRTGLSQSTISMVLARRTDVSFSEDTVKLVHQAAKELGYSAVSRKRLALFTKRTVMVVCPVLLNHYYSSAIQTIQSAASEMQWEVLVYTTYNNSAEECRILKIMAESEIGGVIFAMMPQSKNLLSKIGRTLPIVVIADKDGEIPVKLIELHNYTAGAIIARHLAELGHRRVACISTPPSSSVLFRTKRYDGIRDTWNALCPDGEVRLFTNFASPARLRDDLQMERVLGREITESILENEDGRFTAIIALNDMLAYGALDAMHAAGKDVPGDYSVCGCDNDFPSSLTGVNLTSVEHFMPLNARQAFLAIYRKIMDQELSSNTIPLKNIQPELIKRASTGAPRATFL